MINISGALAGHLHRTCGAGIITRAAINPGKQILAGYPILGREDCAGLQHIDDFRGAAEIAADLSAAFD